MKKFYVLGAAVFVALVVFATADAYACDEWCEYEIGEGYRGWACYQGNCPPEECAENCEATVQDCECQGQSRT